MKKRKYLRLVIIPRIFNILKSFKLWLYLTIIYYLFCSSIYAIMSLVKHSHYETLGDLGMSNQAIWQYSKFQWPIVTFHLQRPFLGDHFNPILIFITPLYWINANEKTLLFIQPFIMLFAVIPLFLISFRLTKSIIFSFSIIVAYSLYIPLQYTLFYDFHEIVFVPPLFALAYYFFLKNKKLLVSLFLFLLLITKEEVGFFVGAFGLYLLIFNRKWRLFGLIWFILGMMYSLIIMYIILPKIGGSYLYFDYGKSGSTPVEVLGNFLKNPRDFTKLFFDHPIKKETLKRTFWPFAYLPLFSPMGFILSVEQFFTRFIDQKHVTRWTIAYHYSATITIVVALGTVWSAYFYTKFIKKYRKIALTILAIIILILTRIEQVNTSAVLLIKRHQFWEREQWMDYIDEALKLIPHDSAVASQNNITPHLSSRKYIYFLDEMDKTEYVLVDFHKGQSDYNFFGKEKWQKTEEKIKLGIKKGYYQLIYNKGEVYLIKNLFNLNI